MQFPETNARRKAVEQYALALREKLGENLVQVILFGSVARGEATALSDTDVFVVLKRRNSKLSSLVSSIAYEIDGLYDFSLCLSNIVRSEKECLVDGFLVSRIRKEGVELYAADSAREASLRDGQIQASKGSSLRCGKHLE